MCLINVYMCDAAGTENAEAGSLDEIPGSPVPLAATDAADMERRAALFEASSR